MIKRKAEASPEQASSRARSVVTPASAKTTATATNPAVATDRSRVSLSPKPPISNQTSARKKVKYEERQGAGTVVATYQPELPGPSAKTSNQPRCLIAWRNYTTNVQKPYRHFFTSLPQKAQALETHLNRLSQLFQETYAFGQGDLAALEAVGLPRQEPICCLGRICSSVRTWLLAIAYVTDARVCMVPLVTSHRHSHDIPICRPTRDV